MICRIGIGSAGSTAAFILGACNVPLAWQLWANVITFLAGIPGLLYVAFFQIANDSAIGALTTAHLMPEHVISTTKEYSFGEKSAPDPEKIMPISIVER